MDNKERRESDPKAPAPLSVFPPKRIMVPVDGSENSIRALKVAIEICKSFESELKVLNVIRIPVNLGGPEGFNAAPVYYEYSEDEAKRIVEDAKKLAESEGIPKSSGRIIRAVESVVGEIIDNAYDEKVDLIIVGTRGLGGFKRLLMGSVSSGVVTHAHCNVLVVR